jgi:inositol transport system ATP-binding protein
MVEISKAISNNSKILIMDEPTSAITTEEVHVLFRVMRELKAKGVSIIYISHKMDEIFEIADRVTVMRDGKFIGCQDIKSLTEKDLISMMVGREISEMFPKTNIATDEEILRVEGLCGKCFRNISFTLHRGEILGFAGLMGAGRTEIMRAIFGLDPIFNGDIYLKGKKIKIQNTHDSISQGIGYVSEDRKGLGLVLGMSVKENVTMSCLKKFCTYNWINRSEEIKVTKEQIDAFSIKTPTVNQSVINLSGGNQQKVVLSKTLLSQPEVIILDEPTRGIDVGAKVEIHKMISDLANQGKGIILISSEMPEILGMSDRIVVISEGNKMGELMQSSATQEKIMSMILLDKKVED